MYPSTTLRVRLTPRASQDALQGWEDDVLRVRVRGRLLLEGRANVALLRLLAGQLGLSRGALALQQGERSRLKTVSVEGLDGAEVRRRLGVD